MRSVELCWRRGRARRFVPFRFLSQKTFHARSFAALQEVVLRTEGSLPPRLAEEEKKLRDKIQAESNIEQPVKEDPQEPKKMEDQVHMEVFKQEPEPEPEPTKPNPPAVVRFGDESEDEGEVDDDDEEYAETTDATSDSEFERRLKKILKNKKKERTARKTRVSEQKRQAPLTGKKQKRIIRYYPEHGAEPEELEEGEIEPEQPMPMSTMSMAMPPHITLRTTQQQPTLFWQTPRQRNFFSSAQTGLPTSKRVRDGYRAEQLEFIWM